jgi:hypothetical protein
MVVYPLKQVWHSPLGITASLKPISSSKQSDYALCDVVHVKNTDQEGKNERKWANLNGQRRGAIEPRAFRGQDKSL